jgi:hypothetical protein
MSDISNGTQSSDGRVTCQVCGRVSKNAHGHTLHYTLKHGTYSGSRTKKKRKYTKKKDLPQVSQRALEVGPGTMTIEAPGEISGQKFILTVDLSIAATGIRPV